MIETKEILKLSQKKRYIPFSEKNVPIRMDGIFKIVMGNPANQKYLKEFLEAILHRKIYGILFVETEKLLLKAKEENKDMKLDLVVQFENGEIVDVEIQNAKEKELFERSVAYSVGILYNDYNKTDKYNKGKKTIIWILDYNFLPNSTKYHEIFTYKNEDASQEISLLEQHFIQLPLFIEQIKEIKTEEEKWLAYFSGQLNEEELKGVYKMSRSIEEINEIVDAVMNDPDVAYALEARRRKNIDMYFAKKEQLEEVAEKMIKKNKPIEEIVEFTGLSKEIIEKLQKEIKEVN